MTACHNKQHVSSIARESLWPLDKNTLWLREDARIALISKDYSELLLLAGFYKSPEREILEVEVWHALKNLDQEARVLQSLVDQRYLSVRASIIVLSRHSRNDLLKYNHPLVQIANVNSQFFGHKLRSSLQDLCENGNKYACFSFQEKTIKKVALLLPMTGKLSQGAKYFRNGFMHALMQSGSDISVETIDVEKIHGDELSRELQNMEVDWVIGPMGRSHIQAIASLNLPYLNMPLGECDAGHNIYCFPLSSSLEVQQIAARLTSLGAKNIFLISSSDAWYKNWESSFLKIWHSDIKSYKSSQKSLFLKDMQKLKLADAVIFNMSYNEILDFVEYMRAYSLKSRLMLAPSISGEKLRNLGISYFDSRIFIARDNNYLSPLWINTVASMSGDVPAKYKKFLAWGIDAFMWMELGPWIDWPSGVINVASASSYVSGHNIIRSLDIVSSYSELSDV